MCYSLQKPDYVQHLDTILTYSFNREAIANVLWDWRLHANTHIGKFMDVLIANSDLVDPDYELAIRASAAMAMEHSHNDYHNFPHSLDVTTCAILLGSRAVQLGHIDKRQFSLLVIAAVLHDYKHSGTPNSSIQFKQEQRAFDHAAYQLLIAGLDLEDLNIVEAMILATDVSKDFNDDEALSPSETLKNYLANGSNNANILHPRLRILHGTGMAEVAQILQDSDVGLGMADRKFSYLSGVLLALKNGMCADIIDSQKITKRQLLFMDELLSMQMHSRAGKEIIQPWMQDVRDFHESIMQGAPAPYLPKFPVF